MRIGLSVSTVGRAVADDHRISRQTKFRVREAADQMGYVSNRAARMMRGASSNMVGLVLPHIRNSFYATIAHELSKNLTAQGFELMLAARRSRRSASDDQRARRHRGVGHVLVLCGTQPTTDEPACAVRAYPEPTPKTFAHPQEQSLQRNA
jgi:DNA-binding LacI/PurR family transcriptional regulator